MLESNHLERSRSSLQRMRKVALESYILTALLKLLRLWSCAITHLYITQPVRIHLSSSFVSLEFHRIDFLKNEHFLATVHMLYWCIMDCEIAIKLNKLHECFLCVVIRQFVSLTLRYLILLTVDRLKEFFDYFILRLVSCCRNADCTSFYILSLVIFFNDICDAELRSTLIIDVNILNITIKMFYTTTVYKYLHF